nr:reverse transcriptase domain-containing protein [Tanacetum cinerariifolium]
MANEDEEKTTFITSQGIFCYSKMPFGLKNVEATYQRLVDKAFQKQIGRNLEVYVDDLVIKSCTEEEVIRDIEETFKTLREINMKLNPKKCTFGMREGTFLGYKVNPDGLKLQKKLSVTTERDGKQMPIYFVNRALQGLEINNTPLEKLILALMLSNPEVTKRLLKWSFELEEHDIYYRPRTSIKGKILADFIMKCLEDDPQDTTMEDEEVLLDPWILFTDGSSCIDGSGVGLIITNPKGMEFTYALRFRFDATNNEAEYEAVIAGLQIAERMRVKNIQANVDSSLVANQVNETYVAKEPGMVKYLEKVKNIASNFKEFSIKQNPGREQKSRCIKQDCVHQLCSPEQTKGIMPEERKKARAIRHKARRYAATDGVLYKKSFLGPWLRCVGPLHANYVLREIHEGSCSMHAGPMSVVAKALRSGLCEKLCIRQCFASVKHPQANGLVERANRSLGEGIKAWLDERSKNWLEEISHVLWAHRTMIKSSNGETPFSLTYGSEVVIPVEIGMPTLRTTKVDVIKNNETLGVSLDLLKEKKEHAAIQEAKSKAKMEKYYNARVRNTSFRSRDLVYRNNEASRAEDGGKLGPKWEGPYEVTEALGKGAYKLRDRNRNTLPRTWNVCNLKKCYMHEIKPNYSGEVPSSSFSKVTTGGSSLCGSASNTWSLTTEVGRTTSEEAKVVERVVMGAAEVDDLKGGREGEVEKIVIAGDEEIEDDNLREKLLKVNILIAEIEALKDNPTPSSEFLTKSSSTSPTPFLEGTNTFHNSLPELENFCFDLEDISSGNTTTHSVISLPEYEAFSFYDNHIEEISSGSTTTQSGISLPEYDSFIFDLSNDQFPPSDRSDLTHEEFGDEFTNIISPPEYDCFYLGNLPDPSELISSLNSGIHENLSFTTCVNLPVEDDYAPLLAYVVWIFLTYLTYPVIPPHPHSFGNEDTIFDPGITITRFYSFKPGLSHRCETFKKFNTHRSHLNGSPMEMLFSILFPMDQ